MEDKREKRRDQKKRGEPEAEKAKGTAHGAHSNARRERAGDTSHSCALTATSSSTATPDTPA